MNASEEIEEFLSKFTRDYIHLFNMLERNISYSLRNMRKSEPSSNTIEEIQALSFCKKTNQLKKYFTKTKLKYTFSSWFETLESCRILRNNLVHGNWEVAWFLDKPIRFDACEVTGKLAKPIRGEYTTKDLSVELKKIEQVSEDFSKLRKEYEKLNFTQQNV